MEKAVLDFVVEQTNALIAAPTTAAECKAAAEAWLASDKGEAANKAYIAELEADIMPLRRPHRLRRISSRRPGLRRRRSSQRRRPARPRP